MTLRTCIVILLGGLVGASLSLYGATAQPVDQSLSIQKKQNSWVINYQKSPVTLSIPHADKFSLLDFMAKSHPRYFYFVGAGITISGWYEPFYLYKGLKEFWEKESARFYANPATTPANVVFGKTNTWEVVMYDLPLALNAIGVNLRAEFSQGGTWIDLHMSKGTDKAHAAEERQRLIALIEQIKVTVAATATVSAKEIESAAADLTERIGSVDDLGYQKALKIVTRYLESQPLEKYRFSDEATPWASEKSIPQSASLMLNIAFLASQIQDELQAVKNDRLYHAWLIIIKYYQHYTDPAQTGGQAWPKCAAIEELIIKQKSGKLSEFANTVPLLRK